VGHTFREISYRGRVHLPPCERIKDFDSPVGVGARLRSERQRNGVLIPESARDFTFSLGSTLVLDSSSPSHSVDSLHIVVRVVSSCRQNLAVKNTLVGTAVSTFSNRQFRLM
jgi:hypothetical protein